MRLLAVLMAGLLPVSTAPLGAGPPAVRHATTAGTVWINAAALPSGSSLYNGDTLATADNGLATITGAGQGRLEVRPDSLVSFSQQEVALKGGVVGSEGLAVRLGADLIRPAGKSGPQPWFVVADRGGQRLIAAYEGDVLIARDGAEPVLIPQGSFAIPAGPPLDRGTPDRGTPPDDPDTDRQSGHGPIPTDPDGPTGPDHGWMILSLSSAASVAFIVSLGATAAVATLIGYTLGENSVSPSN
jgi:hypothetical protein